MRNPVSVLPAGYNNGVVIKMPQIPDTQQGAISATGELILGLDTAANNSVPVGASKVYLGVSDTTSDSYLGIKTTYNNHVYTNSYLDTGSNGMFFYDASIAACSSKLDQSYWYCPQTPMRNLSADLSDGEPLGRSGYPVQFGVSNKDILLSLSENLAFNTLAGAVNTLTNGAYVPDTKTFAWGMPFFYGKTVYLSIWEMPGAENGPWYAWTTP
jgi:hypothetical protein